MSASVSPRRGKFCVLNCGVILLGMLTLNPTQPRWRLNQLSLRRLGRKLLKLRRSPPLRLSHLITALIPNIPTQNQRKKPGFCPPPRVKGTQQTKRRSGFTKNRLKHPISSRVRAIAAAGDRRSAPTITPL